MHEPVETSTKTLSGSTSTLCGERKPLSSTDWTASTRLRRSLWPERPAVPSRQDAKVGEPSVR